MYTTRRNFIKTLPVARATLSLPATAGWAQRPEVNDLLKQLDEAQARPVLKRDLFPEPVIIKDVQLLHYAGSFLCQVTSSDGAEGLCVSNNLRMDYLYPIFTKRVAPFFLQKDARDLDQLVHEVYRYISNYKMQSYALGVPVATVEFAVLDMLGKMAGKSLGALIGEVVNPAAPIYLATRFREKSAEASIEEAQQRMDEHGSRRLGAGVPTGYVLLRRDDSLDAGSSYGRGRRIHRSAPSERFGPGLPLRPAFYLGPA